MAEKGWYGRPDKTAKDKKYINWRLKTIYQTNVLTAYSAGETREMLRTATLYPYWQYKQVQRSTKRESHSAFHDMVLRYDDPFWATGTPPNGWGCQCYRSQLSESQAKAQGGPTTPPTDNIINANIQKEWRYDPGREMLAPNFTRFSIEPGSDSSAALAAAEFVRDMVRRYDFPAIISSMMDAVAFGLSRGNNLEHLRQKMAGRRICSQAPRVVLFFPSKETPLSI